MTDLVIYDTEASDLDVRHGQITQFGAIRADTDFNVLAETDIRVRRLPWIVPSPEALKVTGTSAHELSGEGTISEYRASELIESFLVPGYGQERIFITFNGRFDDELIRSTLFRNLRSPWFTSGKLSVKVDLLDMVRLACAAGRDLISVPVNDKGQDSWRLENLCPANGIRIEAHRALGDSYATMELARLVRKAAPWAWETAVRCGLASRCESLLAKAASTGEPVFLFTHFGKAEVVPAAVLGTDKKKKWVLADLRGAREIPSDREEIASLLFTAGTPLPVIRSNNSPYLLDRETAMAIDPQIDLDGILSRAVHIKDSPIPEMATASLKSRTYEKAGTLTSEERIYSGFVSDWDKPTMTRFHRAHSWQEKASLKFRDDRLADFAARIVLEARHYGEADLSEGQAREAEALCSEALSRPWAAAEDARWTTLASAALNADDEWLSWASAEFGHVPGAETTTFQNVEDSAQARQMDFGF